jgi:GNAT superfamily N-acetyltransferase
LTSQTRGLTVVKVGDERQVRDWLAVPHLVFADDPAWVPPLRFLERRRISPKHAPFFSFGEACLFLAYRNGTAVGRISAQINRRHLERYHDATGHFGFFDCIDDPDAALALVSAAELWLRERGLSRMVGPLNFSVNEECGCLISGFETPPAVLMPHSRTWTGRLLETAGLVKAIDLFAYRLIPSETPNRVYEIAQLASHTSGVATRGFNMQRYADEVRMLVEIFNDAWSSNWGFVPFSPVEIDALIAEMRPFFRGNYGRFVLFNHEPVGFMVGLPNINEIIALFDGRLLPFNWIRLLWWLRMERARSVRVPLLGLRKSYQSTPIGGMLLALLVSELLQIWRHYNHRWVEFSWVLENNRRMVELAQLAAGPPAKIYRIYQKMIDTAR